MAAERDCYSELKNGATIRLSPGQWFAVYRKGEAPTTPRGKKAQDGEMKTFHRYAAEAGLQLAQEWTMAEARPGFYGGRYAVLQPELLGVQP